MKTIYNFEDDLAALRILLSREHHFSEEKRYRKPNHLDLRGLLLTLEEWLRIDEEVDDTKERREIRLKILSFILEIKVRTTYDLTVYQCSTIAHFLWNGPENPDESGDEEPERELGNRAVWFLEDCKDRVEGKVGSREGRTEKNISPRHVHKARLLTDLSDLWEGV